MNIRTTLLVALLASTGLTTTAAFADPPALSERSANAKAKRAERKAAREAKHDKAHMMKQRADKKGTGDEAKGKVDAARGDVPDLPEAPEAPAPEETPN